MIETEGRVSRAEKGIAWVDVTPVSACGGCAQKSGCGTSALASMLRLKRSDLKVIDEYGVAKGDWVKIGLDETAMLRTALLVYGLPILGFVLGAVAASIGFEGDVSAAIGGMAGIALGWFVAKWQSKRWLEEQRFYPRILKSTLGGFTAVVN